MHKALNGNIVLFGENSANQTERLRSLLGPGWKLTAVDEDAGQAEIDDALSSAQIFVSRSFDQRHRNCRDLRLVHAPGAGWDRIDPGLLPKGGTICNAYGHEIAIAEYVMMSMLEWQIGLFDMKSRFRAGSWGAGRYGDGCLHGELHGKHLGILGFGAVGTEVARRASNFSMKIGAISRNISECEFLDWSATIDQLKARVGDLDFLLICCPLTDDTKGMIDGQVLSFMKPNSVIINIARAEIIEEQPLHDALITRQIAGAFLDVWYRYPSSQNPSPSPSRVSLRELPNVIATPHSSGWTSGMLERKWQQISMNVMAWDAPKRLKNVVFRARPTPN